MNLKETTTTFADFRALQREAGIIPHDDTHRVFLVLDDGRMTLAAQDGDAYEAIKKVMLKVMLEKLPDIEHTAAVIIEASVGAKRVEHEEGAEPTVEQIEEADRIDGTLTMGCDGATIAVACRADEPNADLPDDEELDNAQQGGRLGEAVETLTLGILLARRMVEEKRKAEGGNN